ncbi:hypothetical protein I3842_01G135500 [Carya illinoinensis]|uniref:Uncharacterized protein n=1 Tax=Carya illinoinensis TaxID=32201 RepID=A0A922K3M2_CARIL|nr:hypothetical protein I3842_01G135500 [Carya illinoinensis]
MKLLLPVLFVGVLLILATLQEGANAESLPAELKRHLLTDRKGKAGAARATDTESQVQAVVANKDDAPSSVGASKTDDNSSSTSDDDTEEENTAYRSFNNTGSISDGRPTHHDFKCLAQVNTDRACKKDDGN